MSSSYRVLVYADRWRDICRNGVIIGTEQVLVAAGTAVRSHRRALRIMQYLRKRGLTFTFIQRAS